jgi:hypothetical protein
MTNHLGTSIDVDPGSALEGDDGFFGSSARNAVERPVVVADIAQERLDLADHAMPNHARLQPIIGKAAALREKVASDTFDTAND